MLPTTTIKHNHTTITTTHKHTSTKQQQASARESPSDAADMLLPSAQMATQSSSIALSIGSPLLVNSAKKLAQASLIAAAAATTSTTATRTKTTALKMASSSSSKDGDGDSSSQSRSKPTSNSRIGIGPRAKSCVFMASSMALHFGGYEFARSGALALYTSSTTGFTSPAAYPFAVGMATPASLLLLYWYGLVLKSGGPRKALFSTSLLSIAVLSTTCAALALLPTGTILSKALVALLFIFQNSYAHLLYTQQWSFLGSVMTPTEGTKWFSFIAGLSSIVCTATASMVKPLTAKIGLLGLIGGTCVTLIASLMIADQSYELAEQNGFDPAQAIQQERAKKEERKSDAVNNKNSSTSSSINQEDPTLFQKTSTLFRKVPTLAALFGEVLTFQSLATILGVCYVRQLKVSVPLDTERASFSGNFYAGVNGISGIMQFFVLPLARRILEPKWVYKLLPCLLVPILAYLNFVPQPADKALLVTAGAFFCLKTLDYSFRNVVNEMVYQPLDFESRYLGKEVIGVFASRFGKSGMSLLISFATAQFAVGIKELSQFSLVLAGTWTASSFWLSQTVVSNKEAERAVQERTNKKRS
mmetsp:Transcript_14111/g.40241  ORF Transcript_14111/g.40241 Transcript_14111/m.40241 type:complete len:588 (-) Transcript_14111:50-1813(-)